MFIYVRNRSALKCTTCVKVHENALFWTRVFISRWNIIAFDDNLCKYTSIFIKAGRWTYGILLAIMIFANAVESTSLERHEPYSKIICRQKSVYSAEIHARIMAYWRLLSWGSETQTNWEVENEIESSEMFPFSVHFHDWGNESSLVSIRICNVKKSGEAAGTEDYISIILDFFIP